MKLIDNIANYFGYTQSSAMRGTEYPRNPETFTGEVNRNELGDAIDINIDRDKQEKYAIEAFTKDSNIANLTEKHDLWLVGTGLQLQASPKIDYLKKRGVTIPEGWTTDVDTGFQVWAGSKDSTLTRESNFHSFARECLRNSMFFRGDILIICHVDSKNNVSVESVEGKHIKTPLDKKGRYIVDGVEFNKSNQAVAFHVEQSVNVFRRIPARNANGQLQAWLVYGRKLRTTDARGINRLGQVLEIATVVRRLRSTILKAAEEAANVVHKIRHGINSDGRDPFKPGVFKERENASSSKVANLSPSEINSQIRPISQGAVLNLGTDQEYDRYNGEGANSDSMAFYGAAVDTLYNGVSLPPEIGKDKFGGSYSASQMVAKTWEAQFIFLRTIIPIEQIYQPVYQFWLEIQMMTGEVQDQGYFSLSTQYRNAFLNATYRGPAMPHIDPLKTINAIRKALGPAYANMPIGTLEDVIEKYVGSDASQSLKKGMEELKNYSEFNTFIPKVEKPANV